MKLARLPVVSTVATAVERLFTRSAAIEAAGAGRRFAFSRQIANPAQAISDATQRTRHRTQHQALNNPWLSNGIDSIIANAVGTGLSPLSEHPSEAVRTALSALWRIWSEHSDHTGNLPFGGLQSLVVRQVVTAGESFVRLVPVPVDGSPLPLSLQIIDPEQVPTNLERFAVDGNRIIAGIEFDRVDRRVAVHAYPNMPGDRLSPLLLDPIRIDAKDILHCFEVVAPGQVRGLSRLSTTLLRTQTLDEYEDATGMRQKVASLFTGFLFDDTGTVMRSGAQSGQPDEPEFEPGLILRMPTGARIEFPTLPELGPFDAFIKSQLRGIAAGLGVPEYLVSGDLSGANYSSLRAGLIEFRRRLEQLQQFVIIHQFCRPIWRRFVTTALLTGNLPLDSTQPLDQYFRVRWLTPRWEWVDPAKDLTAEKLAHELGIKSRSESIGERGRDPAQVDREIAADNFRLPAQQPLQDPTEGVTDGDE